MESNYKPYDFEKSLNRLETALNGNVAYHEVDSIPSRDKLTFNNGYYVKCSALFVDIRKSSQLPTLHKRPVLAKIYRSYISEIVSILNSFKSCKEINIVGDCVSGIFDGTTSSEIREVYQASHTINGIVEILNHKLRLRNITPISIGIGMAHGRALMIKTGANGSGINDVVWMGEVVNQASNYCNMANKDGNRTIIMDSTIYSKLPVTEQKFFSPKVFQSWYHGNVTNSSMYQWLKQEKKKYPTTLLDNLNSLLKR